MINCILGEKIGMSQIFSPKGELIPVTVVRAGPCFVIQKKKVSKEGYNAVQVGFKNAKEKKLKKPLKGHFEKTKIPPLKFLREFRIENPNECEIGQEIKANIFKIGDFVDVGGISKGKGFQGVMKRHGFHGGPASHGQSDRKRAPGSIGGSSYPSRVFKGMKMAGRMGGEKKTIKNLEVIEVKEDENIILLKGSIPGAKKFLVVIKKSKRGSAETEKKVNAEAQKQKKK